MSSSTSSPVRLPKEALTLSPRSEQVFQIFKQAQQNVQLEPPSTRNPKRKSEELFDYMLRKRVTNRTQFEMCDKDDVLQFLLMPNIESLLPRAFNYVSMQLRTEKMEPYTEEELPIYTLKLATGVGKIRQFLCGFQRWTIKQYRFFGYCLLNVANWNTQKKNCVWVWGPSNSGKSTLMASFVDTYFPQSVGKPDNNVRTSFPFNNCVNKRIIFWEEPYITLDNVEDVKCLLSGTKFSTDIKYQSAVEIEKTPVFVTANRTPWHARSDTDVWLSRTFTFRLNEPIKETTDLYFSRSQGGIGSNFSSRRR